MNTANPANPLDNQAAIAQLNEAINTIVTDIVRPTTLQTQANAQAIAQLTEQIDRAENIARLADEASSENEQRFDVLLAEAREDRKKIDRALDELAAERERSDQRFQAMQENIQRLFLEIRSTNIAVSGLSERVDTLEAS